ncbi:MAG: hypothetical protein ABIN83_04310 [Sphingomicrobium sp.]
MWPLCPFVIFDLQPMIEVYNFALQDLLSDKFARASPRDLQR